MADDEDSILAQARAGDATAFGALVRRYQRRVYAVALHLTGNHSDAEDVAQEAFVRAFRGLRSFDGRADVFTWLYRIVVNTGLNRLRTTHRSRQLAVAGAAETDHVGGRPEALGPPRLAPDEQAELTEETRTVLAEVAQLSPTLRVTLVLATIEDLPHRQVAKILGVPEGTVAWRVNEARRILRSRLEATVLGRTQKSPSTERDP